jgi:hypothetical protein
MFELNNLATLASLKDAATIRANAAARRAAAAKFDALFTAFGEKLPSRTKSNPMVTATYIPGVVNTWQRVQWQLAIEEVEAARTFHGDWSKLESDLDLAYGKASSGPAGIFTIQNSESMADYVDVVLRLLPTEG